MQEYRIGNYRPIYLWAGPGTIRMNRLKFMDQPVDEAVHMEAHELVGAKRVVEEMECNWIHLMYDWGFPPEVEEQDWDDFEKGANHYHALGAKVFAYIQTSNCAYQGSFKERDWYALNVKGKKIYYYSGRYMTNMLSDEWRGHIRSLIKDALERGADGIFYDNLWHGAMPTGLNGVWLGSIGYFNADIRERYKKETGKEIPTQFLPENEDVNQYLAWRAGTITEFVREMSDYARSLKSDVVISANDFDIVMRNAYMVYGQRLEDLAGVQTLTMIENFGLPGIEEVKGKTRFANNALTLRVARAMVGDQAHLSVLSYDVGIGWDGVYTSRRYQQAIAETAACGNSMTIKGTEYFDGTQHTLLIDEKYLAERMAIGNYNRWLKQEDELYQDTINQAPVGVLYPELHLWLDWQRMAGIHHGALQTLTWTNIPWRVVKLGENLAGISVLYVFNAQQFLQIRTTYPEIQTIFVPDLEGWEIPPHSGLYKKGLLLNLTSGFVHSLTNLYFSSRPARRLFDRIGLQKLITQSPLFYLPSAQMQKSLLDTVPQPIYPRVKSKEPILVEVWKKKKETQMHLVNYSNAAQEVSLTFPEEVKGFVVSPDTSEINEFEGKKISLTIDIYSILRIKK